ncbi:MAG: C69 family dipeptidase, partial [Oscillospiraceae bacterium]
MKDYAQAQKQYDRGNCSTIIIGKGASKTGRVIVGHNEDDTDSMVYIHLVPRVSHKEGDTISFPDGKAIIPQVAETLAYYWSEIRCPGGISFADGFVNECGVAVVSNACGPSNTSPDEPQDVGLGYGLRRLVAERAKTAREGVEVAAALVAAHGYFSARTYTISDKNEAWVFQVPVGRRYVAQRVGDDEIFYIPNWFTIHGVDFADKDHKKFYFSDDLAQYPARHGWYKPAKEGDFSDFDFTTAYQAGQPKEHCFLRASGAWELLLGRKPENIRPFSLKAEKKYGVEDIKKVLRSHLEGTAVDRNDGYKINPHPLISTICNAMTTESCVIEFNDDPKLICVWRASQKPCISPYIPWYMGLNKVPKGYGWSGPMAAQASHFFVDEGEFSYDTSKAYWAFRTLEYLTEIDYKGTHQTIQNSIRTLEDRWDLQKSAIEKAYGEIKALCAPAAEDFITQY